MIKAGEEALRSSASREALNYYQEALSLYLNKYGDTADPEKLKMLEKNIGIAFFNKGEYENALTYFDRVLKRWGIKPPQNKILIRLKLLFDILKVISHLYFPSIKSVRIPDHRDNEIFDLSWKKAQTLTFVDPTRHFPELIGDIKKILGFDLRKIENGYNWLSGGSGLFSYTGISFRLSNRLLEYTEGVIDNNNYKELFTFNFFKLLHNCMVGNWEDIQDYDESLLDHNLKIGQFWEASIYLNFYVLVKQDQGEFKVVQKAIKKLSEIADRYEYQVARTFQLTRETSLLTEYKKLYDAKKKIRKIGIVLY